MAENKEPGLHKRLSSEETDLGETSNDSQQQLSPKPVQVDKAYEGIQGHERHILFHFFMLFCISFLVGVVFIHLSLWMNSHLIYPGFLTVSDISDETERSLKESNAATGGDAEATVLQNMFYYTGNYFSDKTVNISSNLQISWQQPRI